MVVAGSATRVSLSLIPLPGSAPTIAVLRVEPVVEAPPAPEAGAGPTPIRVLPITLMAVGGGLFIGGASLGIVGLREASQAPTRDGAEAHAARVKGVAGDVIAGTGIAAAGVGLILLLTSGKPRPAPTRVGLWTSGTTAGIEARF
jgi:hypothetical protein